MGDIFKIIGDLGFPVAAALAGGYFVYLTIKLLLQGVLGSVKGMAGIITVSYTHLTLPTILRV